MEWSVYDGPEGNGTLENRLVYWLTLDKWAIDEAAKIISNIVPDQSSINANEGFSNITFFGGKQIPQLDEEGFPETCSECRYVEGCECWELDKTELLKFTRTVDDIKRLLARSFGEDGYVSPKDAVVFITSKKLQVNWLNFAIRVGLITIEPNEETEPKISIKPKDKNLAQTWWRTEYDILGMAQSAGDSLRRKGKRTSNRAIGNVVALEIENKERSGKKRPPPDGQTIKNTDLKGWKYVAE